MSNVEQRASAAIMEYAAARADHWLRSNMPMFTLWGHLYGPFCLHDHTDGITVVCQAWKIGDATFALQLFMPPLGAIERATWYIPKGLAQDDLYRRKRPDL